MPSDANGAYSLPPGYLATTGDTIQASQHNPPLEDLGSAMTQRVMRSGATPMAGPLKLVNGSASAPSMTFNTATATGLYKTTDGIGVAVNGQAVLELSPSAIAKGVRFIGELISYSGLTARPLTVLPYGQTLNRADYSDLWTFAQAEIEAGSTFYNNGNGTTTFGIGDLRGRVLAGWDKMGGTAAGRLTTTGSGFDGSKIGAAGGAQTVALVEANNGVHKHDSWLHDPGHNHGVSGGTKGGQSVLANPSQGGPFGFAPYFADDIRIESAGAGLVLNNAWSGSGTPHANTQPTFVCNFLLFAGA